MLMRFNTIDSYSVLRRILTRRTRSVPRVSQLAIANRYESTSGPKSSLPPPRADAASLGQQQLDKSEPITSAISKYYSDFRPSQFKLSPNDLVKVRESQRNENLLLNRRRLYEKITLQSYLNVCIDVGQINRAFNTLIQLINANKHNLVDIGHYNIVIKGWAKLASTAQIVETRMHMIRNNIQPNHETFAYVLLGYAKAAETRKTVIKRILEDMQGRNIDPAYLFHHTYLGPSDRKSIRTYLRQVDPSYDDVFCHEPIEYDCKLLKEFDRNEYHPYDLCGDTLDLTKIDPSIEHQRSVEHRTSISIKSVAKTKTNARGVDKYLRLWQKLNDSWRVSLTKALEEGLDTLQKQSEDFSKIHLYPYLCSVDRDILVNMMLDEVETNATFSSYSISTNMLHMDFGRKVMTRHLREKSIDEGSHTERQKLYYEYVHEYCSKPELVGKMTPRQFMQVKAAQTKNYSIYKDKLTPAEEWPQHIVSAVGRFLYGLILREVKFDPVAIRNPRKSINNNNLVHAFYTAYFQIDCTHKVKEEFRAHQDFEKLQQRSSAVRLKFDYSYLPTSSPPLPWVTRRFGGYLTAKSDLVRVINPFAEQSIVTGQYFDNRKLYPSLDSLNSIGLCPWIVNKEILDIIIELFRKGGDTGLNVPLEDSKMEDTMPTLSENPSKSDRILYIKDKKKYEQKRREMYSLWRDCLYRLSIANHFRDRIFWFPHNMDFRGRTYPIPPHFNHLGADLARSLLLFAKGKPLGEKGLDWLKIHLINLVGNMKSSSNQERLDYANSILHLEVLDSADNPWDGRRWWTNNENPWQVLACCKEIAKAIRSLDHRSYVSHFPVHQDGSCNGLQHYAALGRDVGGGMAVNLVPCDKPQDVYSRVVDIVESLRQKDAAQGVKLALMLEGFIQRKVIKQTVMTTVYGVTRYGARQQIARQLIAKGYSEQEVWQAAQYLTTKTFESIGRMFNKSRLIQDWLNDCAFTIASRCRQPVSWDTPLGFTVVQPYVVARSHSSNRLLGSALFTDASFSNDPLARLNSSKQKTAFPPNYIHSLDSSHMMLTSLYCHRQGITFVSVHDCYWTHPSTVDAMNMICREQFIALHSEPLLKDLSEQFIERFGSYLDKYEEAESSRQRAKRDSKRLKSSPSAATAAASVASGSQSTSGSGPRTLMEAYESARQDAGSRTRATFKDVPSAGDLDLKQVRNSTYFFS